MRQNNVGNCNRCLTTLDNCFVNTYQAKTRSHKKDPTEMFALLKKYSFKLFINIANFNLDTTAVRKKKAISPKKSQRSLTKITEEKVEVSSSFMKLKCFIFLFLATETEQKNNQIHVIKVEVVYVIKLINV